MRAKPGLTLLEVLVVIVLLGIVAAIVLPGIGDGRREEARRIRCMNNLNHLAKGMATYLNEYGDNRWYSCPLARGVSPGGYNGAEWLASLYWTGVLPDTSLFVCPSTPDTNDKGRDLGTSRAAPTFGSQTVSYAAMHYRSMTDTSGKHIAGAIRDDFPPSMPMASDDTQGTINHGEADNGGMCILFFDTHVDFKTNAQLDLQRAVGATAPPGQPRPLLWQLRN